MILDILNSVGLQNIIIAISVILTIYIYLGQKEEKIKSAATIVILEIERAESIIEDLKIFMNGEINRMYSTGQLDSTIWKTNQHLLVHRLSQSHFQAIDNFFDRISIINDEKNYLRQQFINGFTSKVNVAYEQIISRLLDDLNYNWQATKMMIDGLPLEFLQNVNIVVLKQTIDSVNMISNTPALDSLLKIAKWK